MSVNQVGVDNAPQTTTASTITVVASEKAHGRKLGDVKNVAAKLDCSTRHVYRLADAGRMPPPLRLGALVRWDLDQIDTWILDGCPPCRKAGGR
jgi:predicted DNA-binding transcriptional regulator AlpA